MSTNAVIQVLGEGAHTGSGLPTVLWVRPDSDRPKLDPPPLAAFRVIVLDCLRADVLLSSLRELQPDAVVLDPDRLRWISLPSPAQLHQAAPKAEWILSLRVTSRSTVELLLEMGAHAAVNHDAPAALWERAIRAVLGGEIWLPRGAERWLYLKAQAALRSAHQHDHPVGFTDREAEIHELLERGLTNKEIARRLRISPNTVKKHVASVFEKVGLRSRRQALCNDAHVERPDGSGASGSPPFNT